MRVDITFRDPAKGSVVFDGVKNLAFENGWVHVTDKFDCTTSFPADTIRSVDKTPHRHF